jgi:hypothetical protein
MAIITTTISERGNGFPSINDHIPGSDGNLYRVLHTSGRINTNDCGAANTLWASLELADWDDIDSDNDIFPAMADIPDDYCAD